MKKLAKILLLTLCLTNCNNIKKETTTNTNKENTITCNTKACKGTYKGKEFINGADIARTEKATWGTIPLSTMKSGIDYSYTKALTTYGIIGVKVWVYTGEKEIDFAEIEEDNRR